MYRGRLVWHKCSVRHKNRLATRHRRRQRLSVARKQQRDDCRVSAAPCHTERSEESPYRQGRDGNHCPLVAPNTPGRRPLHPRRQGQGQARCGTSGTLLPPRRLPKQCRQDDCKVGLFLIWSESGFTGLKDAQDRNPIREIPKSNKSQFRQILCKYAAELRDCLTPLPAYCYDNNLTAASARPWAASRAQPSPQSFRRICYGS